MQREGEIEGEMFCLWSHPKCLQKLGLGQTKANRLEVSQDLPCVWHGPKFLNQHWLPPRVYNSRKLESEVEQRLKPTYSFMEQGHPKKYINHCTRHLFLVSKLNVGLQMWALTAQNQTPFHSDHFCKICCLLLP